MTKTQTFSAIMFSSINCYTPPVMKTMITDSIKVAAEFISSGEVVAFPTETVYGLGANIFDQDAIQKIFLAKGRPTDNPLIAHLGSRSQIEQIVSEITPVAAKLMDAFFPGPLTLVLAKSAEVPPIATAGLATIGVRMPAHQTALDFINACRCPLVAPSANLSGKPSPTTWEAVKTDLDGRISCILKGEQTDFGLESTVVDCTQEIPLVLRAGAITLEQLRAVIPATQLAKADANSPARSPGLKYRHYSPHAQVVVVNDLTEMRPNNSAFIGLQAPPYSAEFKQVLICQNVAQYAKSLFQFFRQCDEAEIQTIYCESVEERGLGLALMDRIKRAANS